MHTYPVEIFAQFSAFYNEPAATVMAVLAYVLAGMQPIRQSRLSTGLDCLFFAPLALPATVLGIGLIYLIGINLGGGGACAVLWAGRFGRTALQK